MRHVAGALPASEERPEQVAMARAVADALASERHLVVRAGTGVGKSLAYICGVLRSFSSTDEMRHVLERIGCSERVVPRGSGRRVVIATATKALQDQLAGKDLPFVAAQLGGGFSFAVLKGRSNYLCMQRVRESADSGIQGELDAPSPIVAGASQNRRAASFAGPKATATGDRAELSVEPDPRVWSAFSVTADECPGAFRCPSGWSALPRAPRRGRCCGHRRRQPPPSRR